MSRATIFIVLLGLGCGPYERESPPRYTADGPYRPAAAGTYERGAVYVLQADARLQLGGRPVRYPCPKLWGGQLVVEPTARIAAGTRVRFEGLFDHRQDWSGEGGSCVAGTLLDGPYSGTRVDLRDQSIVVPGATYRLTAWLK